MELFRLAAVLQMTTAGIPTIYYGEEVARAGGDWPDNRSDMPWGEKDVLPGKGLPRNEALRADYVKLVAIRKAQPALRRGTHEGLFTTGDGYAFLRRDAESKSAVAVAVNRGAEPVTVTFPAPAEWGGRPPKDLFGALAVSLSEGAVSLTLPPRSAAILAHQGAPAWSPDGRKLAVSLSRQDGNLDIYTLDVNTQVLTRLTSGSAIDTEPAWSLDGSQIYFTSDATGGPQVYRVAADGGGAQRVTFEGSYNARPRVAPDGKQLAVVHNDRGNYRIAVVDLARSTTQVLSDGRLDESPSFAPNGEMLIFATREGARGVLATVSANGRIKQRMSALEGDVREPAWSPFPPN